MYKRTILTIALMAGFAISANSGKDAFGQFSADYTSLFGTEVDDVWTQNSDSCDGGDCDGGGWCGTNV